MFRIAINKLFEWLFSRVLASHRGGPCSIPGQDMSVYFRTEMTLVKSLHNSDPTCFETHRLASSRSQATCLAIAIRPAYILVQFMCVHVCSCNTCTGGSYVAGSYVDVPNSH